MDIDVPTDHWVKLKESEQRDQSQDLARGLEEHESDSDTNCNWCAWNSQQKFDTGTGGLVNKGTNWDHLNYNIVEVDQNTEKSPEYLTKLDVIQTPVNNHPLKLVWKTLKIEKNVQQIEI